MFLNKLTLRYVTPLSEVNMAFLLFVGKFRHLPVVENGEVIAMLDIAKCLYDAISRLEKAAEQGSALAVAVEGVERQLGGNFSGIHIVVSALASSLLSPDVHQCTRSH
jgi:hypothetical protein